MYFKLFKIIRQEKLVKYFILIPKSGVVKLKYS